MNRIEELGFWGGLVIGVIVGNYLFKKVVLE